VTAPAEVFEQAQQDLTDWGSAVASGANTAPLLTTDAIEGLRTVLDRHGPQPLDRFRTVCARCETAWPCAEAGAVLKVLGLPEDDE
jgi:hypothetical protein